MAWDSVYIDTAFEAYMKCALWSTTGDGEEPLDACYDEDNISPETRKQMLEDITAFMNGHEADIKLWMHNVPNGSAVQRDYSSASQAGHDFWLTREGHGAGFWEPEWTRLPTNPGTRLTEAAKVYGGFHLYVGDDGMIHH